MLENPLTHPYKLSLYTKKGAGGLPCAELFIIMFNVVPFEQPFN